MTSSLACGILWRFGAIIPAPRSSVKNAMAGDAHAQLRTLCCCQRRGARVPCLDEAGLKLRSRQIRCATYGRKATERQKSTTLHTRFVPAWNPGPSPRRACAAESGRPVPPSPVPTPCLRLRYPNCLLTTVPERVVSVGRKPRERCRVPKVQAALRPATMPYRRLIDDARRP